jgi:hypothetical protein
LAKFFEPGFKHDKKHVDGPVRILPVLKTRGSAYRPGTESLFLKVFSFLPCQRFVSAKLRRPAVSEVVGLLLIARLAVNSFP